MVTDYITDESVRLEEMTGVVAAIIDELENCRDLSWEFEHEYKRVIEPLFNVLIRLLSESDKSMSEAARVREAG
jgi:hypothetical protein